MKELTRKEKIRLSGIRRYGSEEAWRKVLSDGGKKGGSSPKTKPSGFALMTPEERSAAARKGLAKRWGNRGDEANN